MKNSTIICLQEHWLFKCQKDKCFETFPDYKGDEDFSIKSSDDTNPHASYRVVTEEQLPYGVKNYMNISERKKTWVM